MAPRPFTGTLWPKGPLLLQVLFDLRTFYRSPGWIVTFPLWPEDLLQVFCNRSSIARGPFTSPLWPENSLRPKEQVFCCQRIFYRCYMAKVPFTGSKEPYDQRNCLHVFYGQRTFYRSIVRAHFLWLEKISRFSIAIETFTWLFLARGPFAALLCARRLFTGVLWSEGLLQGFYDQKTSYRSCML